MALSIYLNFQGNTEEVLMYYVKVFNLPEPKITRFKDLQPMPGMTLPEELLNQVAHSELEICGDVIMFSDVFPGTELITGNNISILVGISDEAEIRRLFEVLSEGGKIEMPLMATEWSPCYGNLIDRYGIGWQFNLC